MKRRALGKGLGALIPESDRGEPAPREIDIDRIETNPVQPRLRIDETRLEELVASIRENGVLQPILVRPHGERFQLVAGERRLTAAQRAGLLRVPAVIREVPDEKLLELALVENIQREDLDPIEEATAYQNLIETLRLTQEELASRVGKERSTIANALRLLRLPPPVKLLVSEGKLAPGHARALLAAGLPAAAMARRAAEIAGKGWSVRQAESWAQRTARGSKPQPQPDPNFGAAADKLCRVLGTKVEIARTRKGSGTLRIHFYSDEDLARIYSILTAKG